MSPTRVKLDEVLDFSCSNVQHDRVVDLDERVRVTDGAAIMCGDVGNALGGYTNFTNTAQLVLKYTPSSLYIFLRYIHVYASFYIYVFVLLFITRHLVKKHKYQKAEKASAFHFIQISFCEIFLK